MNETLANRLVGILKKSDLIGKSFYNKSQMDEKTISDFETSQKANSEEWAIYVICGEEIELGNIPRIELNVLFSTYSELS